MNRLKRHELESRVKALESQLHNRVHQCLDLEVELLQSRENMAEARHKLWLIRKAFATFAPFQQFAWESLDAAWSIATIDAFQRHAMWIGAPWGCTWRL
jgi:hypothetical protein